VEMINNMITQRLYSIYAGNVENKSQRGVQQLGEGIEFGL
jgi:hypothetical protein